MATWKILPLEVPTDTEIVWIRVKYYYSAPFLAQWNLSSTDFISVANSITYPAYTVARWKSQ